MNALQIGESLSLVLIDAAAKGTVLLAGAWLATFVLRRSSAAVRHRVWGLAMGGLVLLPALSWLLPAWRLPILPSRTDPADPRVIAIQTEPEQQLPRRHGDNESPNDEIAFARPAVAADVRSMPVDSRSPLPSPMTSQLSASPTPIDSESSSAMWGLAVAALVWSLGTSLLLAGVAVGIRRTGRLWRSSQTITDEAWGRLARELCERLGLRRPVHLREHAEPVVPLTWGLLRPIILFPEQARLWSDSMRRAVLLHELAHVHRGDVAYQLLGRFACALYWFHPLAWFGLHRLRQEREHACDDAVVGSGERASDYAEQLLEVARRYRRAGGLALAVEITHGGSLEQRVRALFDAARSHAPVGRRLAASLIAVAGVFVTAIAILRPVAAEPPANAATADDVTDAAPTAGAIERSAQSAADENPGRQKAAELVRALYVSESWIDSARSILIRTQLEQTRAERPNDYSRAIVWAWDDRRIRHETQIRETKNSRVSGWRTAIWDGSFAVDSSTNEPGDNDFYVLGSTSGPFFEGTAIQSMFNEWEIARRHRFWWLPVDLDQWQAREGLAATEDFELAGEEDVNGRPCRVVQSPTGHVRFHIGVGDGRLYRRTWLVVRPEFPGYDRLALYRKIGGDAIKTVYHWEPWLESLALAEQRQARRSLAAAEFEFSRPHRRESLDDYREVAPGCWFPFSRIREFYEFDKLPKIDDVVSLVQARLEETVTEMTVNQALPDELFQIELTDGVKTQDQRYDPIINYNYRKGQTEAERLALREAERERRAREDAGDNGAQDELKARNVLEARVGTAPPPLPKVGWIAGRPLNWEALRGKVVVLHFFDLERERYQQVCQNELPVMQRWHEGLDKSGVVVIGVHRPTNDAAAVQKMLSEFGATYPVLIDAPSVAANGLGLLHDWFETYWWPFAVIVDQRGVVAGYGQLWHGIKIDRKGIYYGGHDPWMPSIDPQIKNLIAKDGTDPKSPRKLAAAAELSTKAATEKGGDGVDHLRRFNDNLTRARQLVSLAKQRDAFALLLLEEAIHELPLVSDEQFLTDEYKRLGNDADRIRSISQEQLVDCLLSAGGMDQAVKLANEIRSPSIQADAWAQIAVKLAALGQRATAIRYLDQALAVAPKERAIPAEFAKFWGDQEASWQLMGLFAVGDACQALGEFDRYGQVLKLMQNVRGKQGDVLSLLLRIAHRQWERKDEPGMQQTLVQIVEACEKPEWATDVIAGFWNDVCSDLLERGKFDDVIPHLDKLDDNARDRKRVGLVREWARSKQMARATAELKHIGEPSLRATAMIFLSRTEAAAGRKEAAANLLTEAIELVRGETNPFVKTGPLVLAVETRALWGDYVAAVRDAKQINATIPPDSWVYSLYNGPRSDYFEMPFQILVGPQTSWMLIARALVRAGKFDEAIKTIDRIPDMPGAGFMVERFRGYIFGLITRDLLRTGDRDRVQKLLETETIAAVREAIEAELTAEKFDPSASTEDKKEDADKTGSPSK